MHAEYVSKLFLEQSVQVVPLTPCNSSKKGKRRNTMVMWSLYCMHLYKCD